MSIIFKDHIQRRLILFTIQKARTLTTLPSIRLTIEHIESKDGCSIGRNYPLLSKKDNHIVGYEIIIDSDWYRRHRHDPAICRKLICHEVAHIETKNHDAHFRNVAKRLGAGRFTGAWINDRL
jgi:hypothetical protein